MEAAAQIRVPAIYGSGIYVGEGGLMSYSADLADLFRCSAGYVEKILKGAKPADLPVQFGRNPSRLRSARRVMPSRMRMWFRLRLPTLWRSGCMG